MSASKGTCCYGGDYGIDAAGVNLPAVMVPVKAPAIIDNIRAIFILAHHD